MKRFFQIFMLLIIAAGLFVVFHEDITPGVAHNNTLSENHTLLIMAADPSESRPGPGACDMAFIVYTTNSTITKTTPLYPGGMAHPTASPPDGAAAQGDTKLYLHDSLWWNDTNKDAKLAQEIVEYNTSIKTDGVVIVKTDALDAIVTAIGPIYTSSGEKIPDNDVIDFIRQEQDNGMSRGGAVQSVGNAIKNATHDKDKRHSLIQTITDQYNKGNIIVVPQSLYDEYLTQQTLDKMFS